MNVEIDNSLTEEEVYRRLPEVGEIEDDGLREETVAAFVDYCPDYFWEVPASSSGKYHHVYHREYRGLWLHTKRAFTAYQRDAPSLVQQGEIDDFEADCGRAAILLHDMFKFGLEENGDDPVVINEGFKEGYDEIDAHTTSDHDVLAAEVLRENTGLPHDVIGCVESHNGPWCDGKQPESPLEQLHHMADMSASDVNQNQAVMDPADELLEQFPNVEVAGESAVRSTVAQEISSMFEVPITDIREKPTNGLLRKLDTIYWDELDSDDKQRVEQWASARFTGE